MQQCVDQRFVVSCLASIFDMIYPKMKILHAKVQICRI